MSQAWAVVLFVAAGFWSAVALYEWGAVYLLRVRIGRVRAWPTVRRLVPVLDLTGMWLATIGVVALAFGRQGYTWEWATCLGLHALMITINLYGRAVLMPSLRAAFKRIGQGDRGEKWEADWRFLWRMSDIGRLLIVLLATGSLLLALLLFSA